MPEANREYKDRLFKFIFGNPQNRAWTLSLYNAVNGTTYTDAESIRLTTIEDAVYMNMKNDVSFLVANIMNFYEQQSTFNPNMPMRFLIYAGMVYAKYIEQSDSYHQYSSSQQKAPTPKCICFYNGKQDKEDKVILSLKDAFDEEADIEVKVTMLNINYGRNRELLDACEPLKEYSWFVATVNESQKELNNLEAAVDEAIDKMPDDCQIKAFLIENRAEVKRMCITEYNEARTRAEDREEGGFAMLVSLVRKGLLSEDKAAVEANMTVAEFRQKSALVTA
ncbi:MAG: hypothetical protein IKH30_19370 [Clostridia bacterium]|nr:hypothetical protein [Clostridia bacterium]MBR4538512.1 hypothetical protein [Clostridia bacterium]